MKIRRRGNEPISIAFLDVITCGFGAIILLLMIAKFGEPPAPQPAEDPRVAEISDLRRDLFALKADIRQLMADQTSKEKRLSAWQSAEQEMNDTILALENRARSKEDTAANRAEIAGELRVAQQRLTEEMRRLYRDKERERTDLIGGIPIDSEYIVFVIDTSGSMFRYAWPRVIEQIVQTLEVYPKVKGIQIMNDMGAYMFASYRGRWIPDTPALRNEIISRLATWNAFSNSSPVEGITAAIRSFYNKNHKMSIYVYGDEFTGRSIRQVVELVENINPKNSSGQPLVRIHAVGFPVQFAQPPHLQTTGIKFATLMRELTRKNSGTFVGLNSFR